MSAEGKEELPRSPRGRRTSLQNWLHAVDTVELISWISKKYGRVKPKAVDVVDGDDTTQKLTPVAAAAPLSQRPETVFTKIVDQSMIGTGIALRAGVLSRQGEIFALNNLTLTPDQIQHIVKNIPEPQRFAEKGLPLGTDKFFYSSSVPSVVRGKNRDEILCSVASTKHLILILVYKKEKQDIAEEMISDLQKYLKNQGV